MMLSWARTLRANGVLGMNERNAQIIQRFNKRKLYPLVDDKLRTKRLALEAGISVPELYGAVESQHDVQSWSKIVEQHSDFVIKPACGAGGDGIIVVTGYSSRRQKQYQLIDGSVISEAGIRHHVSNMATRRSRGKANLHQGAVGCGIVIGSGVTLSGVLGNEIVNEHPDTGELIAGLVIPSWEHVLNLAARCYELTGLGYLGVDIVLDRIRGPLILELNARPGLNIQIANRVGLNGRFAKVDSFTGERNAVEKVALVRAAFNS